ncbi:MAG: ATP-binding cassette domain-containing protein [Leeuwenhoekiella sp.]
MSGLAIDSVNKKFGEREILKGAALAATKGEIIGLLGRNGSGKSTLLKILFGTEKADHQYLKLFNKINPGKRFLRKHINYLPQHNFLPSHVKLEKLLQISLSTEAFQEIRHHSLIRKNLDKKRYKVSGGELRYIEILWTIHQSGSILLLDEPFNGLSPLLREEIIRELRATSKKKSIVITDHDYQNVLELATKRILLQNGTTLCINDSADLVAYGYLPSL